MNRQTKYLFGLAGALALVVSTQAAATLIDFEDAPSHGLSDDQAVTNQYSGEGVTFANAILEDLHGDTPNGFLNDVNQKPDDPHAPVAGQLGNWFLRSGLTGSARAPGANFLTVFYTTAVTAASGDVWDIDGRSGHTEQWEVQAWSGGSYTGVSDWSPLGNHKGYSNSLNAQPWTFNLSVTGGFDEIRFIFRGSKTSNLGLAFDRFNTDSLSVPEPAALGMFGLGTLLIGLFAGLRRRTG